MIGAAVVGVVPPAEGAGAGEAVVEVVAAPFLVSAATAGAPTATAARGTSRAATSAATRVRPAKVRRGAPRGADVTKVSENSTYVVSAFRWQT